LVFLPGVHLKQLPHGGVAESFGFASCGTPCLVGDIDSTSSEQGSTGSEMTLTSCELQQANSSVVAGVGIQPFGREEDLDATRMALLGGCPHSSRSGRIEWPASLE